MSGKCKNCKFWAEISDMCPSYSRTGMKGCSNPKTYSGYSDPTDAEILINGMWSEDDEGWGLVVGPEFGCVNFENGEAK